MEKLADTKPLLEDKSFFLRDLTANFKKGQVFQTALELDIFAKLNTPKTLEAISRELGADAGLTGRFLDVLVALDLLTKKEGTYVTQADLYPFLAAGEPHFSKQLLLSKEEKLNWLNLKEILKHGPVEKEKPDYQYFYDRESIELIARNSLLGRLQKILKIIIELPEFQASKRLIDLGGGHGLFGIGLAQENQDLEVVIFDRPEIIDLSSEFINKYGMENHIKVMAGNYITDDLGTGYDIALEILSFEGNLDQAREFFRNVGKALKPEGLFIIQAFHIETDRTGPLLSLLHDLYKKMAGRNMYMMDRAEIKRALEASGFKEENVIIFPEEFSSQLIIAKKKKDLENR
ncbi:MAG: methyltransferase [Methanosarcina sp.]